MYFFFYAWAFDNIFLVSQVLSLRLTKQTSKNVADATLKLAIL